MHLEKDPNGQYFYNGTRVLVQTIRGEWRARNNPRFANGWSINPFEPEMIKYWYNGPIGVMVAAKIDGEVRVGYSRVNHARGDLFNRKTGIQIAFGRCLMTHVKEPFEELRKDTQTALQDMLGRARRYFKTN